MFLKNSWYVAAWDREIADKPLGRTFLNEPVVLFRDAAGQVVAMEEGVRIAACRYRWAR